mgnify:CR=1 FL=1
MSRERERIRESEITINLTLKEVYSILCDDCKKRLKELVLDKASKELAKRLLDVDSIFK